VNRYFREHEGTEIPQCIFVEPADLTVHMTALRRTQRERDRNRFIINIPRSGYRFVVSIKVLDDNNRARSRLQRSVFFVSSLSRFGALHSARTLVRCNPPPMQM